MPDTKFGNFEDLLNITDIDPDFVEVVRLHDRTAIYGVGPKA